MTAVSVAAGTQPTVATLQAEIDELRQALADLTDRVKAVETLPQTTIATVMPVQPRGVS